MRHRKRNSRLLWGMILLAILYGGLSQFVPALSGPNRISGIVGVLLGLYICSHPAANAVDILFFERGAIQRIASNWSGIGWLALNVLVFLVGWIIIVMGTTRLSAYWLAEGIPFVSWKGYPKPFEGSNSK
jgi:hypothetical protein